MKELTIFGYGSLINEDSLKKTVPSAKNIREGILEGYKRVFDLKAMRRICPKYNKPISVLNIKKSQNDTINGIIFEMDEIDYKALKDREILYEFIEVQIFDENNNKYIKALTPIVHKYTPNEYLLDSEEQKDYLCLALKGAEKRGKKFYEIFSKTTYLNNKKLCECIEFL